MNITRMAAIGLILAAASAGWMVLGTTTQRRSVDSHGRMAEQVQGLWGVPLVQQAPTFSTETPGSDRPRWIMPSKTNIQVDLDTDYRRKGLVWYPTYTCRFNGVYSITNTEAVAQKMRIHFEFPAKGGTYDEFAVEIDSKQLLSPIDINAGVGELIELPPGKSIDFHVAYKTRGIGQWAYRMDPNIGRVRDFTLAVNTGFRDVDYPDGCLSPMETSDGENGGKVLVWKAADLITKENVGVIIPEKLNPGPLASRITYFAPVCLLFFFVLVVTINLLYKVDIHPMHYLFVAAGFFAFHLLLAYLVDVINIHLAFVLSAIVSVFLVTSYLSAALRGQFPWKVAVAGQLFFLVLFSYSFFLKGITGLTVAIGSVVTLAVLMRVTAHIDWNEAFAKPAITLGKVTPSVAIPEVVQPAGAGAEGA